MSDKSVLRRMFTIQKTHLDACGNRLIDIELSGFLTHSQELRKLLRANGPFELIYEVRAGEHLKEGIIDPDKPRFQLVFEHGVDPHGVWEIKIEASCLERKWTRKLWRQLLYVQTKLRLDQERINELARRYAPTFVFGKDEKYFPVSLQTLLAGEEILACDDIMKIKTIFGKEPVPLKKLGEFMRFNGHADYLLDFNVLSMRRSVFKKMGGDPCFSTVYYSYSEDSDGKRFFISYHLIYAFDTKAGIAKLTGIGPHVFDRESMTLVFESAEKPSAMIISGHLENQTISFLEKLKSWTQGRIRVRYDDERTLKLGTHPVIAVAEGSHALYPTSGIYHLSLLRELAGYLDPKVMFEQGGAEQTGKDNIVPEQILAPPDLHSEAVPSYDLRYLGLSEMHSHIDEQVDHYDPFNAFLVFSGFWVDVAGTRNARFPPFTRSATEIADWVDKAYAWDWDDVPERYHRNNDIIVGFLHENVEGF